ncbi:MAG: putative peptidoglycan glycosyltransferase FtsW [Gemmatimonadota bacterium]
MSSPAIQHPGDARWETRLLAVLAATLTVFGIATLYAAASFQRSGFALTLSQLSGAAAGVVLAAIASRMDYQRWRPLAWPLVILTLVLLVIPILPFTHAISPVKNGARRWIEIFGIGFQPSELAKFAIVLWTAMLAAKKGETVRTFKKGVTPFIVVAGVMALLVLPEPNLSTAIIIAALSGIVLFTAGAKIGHFLVLGIGAAFAVVWLIMLEPYRLRRAKCFLGLADGCSEEVTYQVKQSLIGFGSGRVFGVGFGQGQQKLNYLPYAHSDFIFSTIGEEWGFVGVLVIAGLFLLFCWFGLRIARTAPDPFGQYLAVGLTASVGLTALMHMAVTMKLMPTTGQSLPFMSHGRSNLIMTLLGVGILISIGRMRGRARGSG